MAVLTCGAEGSTASEVITQINTNTTDIATNTSDIDTINTTLTTVTSGTYTPTLTAVANLGSVTISSAKYIRVGTTVTVEGAFVASQTASGTTTSFYISLPVASDFTSSYDGYGHGNITVSTLSSVQQVMRISASTTQDAMFVETWSGSTAGITGKYSFTYVIK